MRLSRKSALGLAAVLAATLVQALAPPAAYGAAGPSVPPPSISSEPVTQQGRQAVNTGDETTPRGLNGDQEGGSSLPGSSDYAATSLSPSAAWQVSGHTGDFTWSYPIPVPPAPGGLAPGLALSYSSGAVDGLTSATNNQASWIGDGWSMWPGFIERRYRGCADDLDGTGEEPNDLCWHTDNAVLSLNGSGSDLIYATSNKWKSKDDDGSLIERVAAAGNGDDNGESWKVTTVDGTQYFFGSTAAAKSTWTVPVFGDDANEPCHKATFAESWCDQGYRWNLDKVVDRHGNMIRYYYATETNFYGRNKNRAASSYVRNGWLDHVEYGLHAADATIAASGRVDFTVEDRCVKNSDCVHTKPDNLPDVPLDLKCDGGTCVDKWSPSFWTTKKLTTITTKSLVNGEYKAVDSWALRHELPDPGDGEKPALWLKGITHTGHTATTAIALPEVTFDGVRKENRVHGNDAFASLVRFRMNAIVSETGGVTSIRYEEPDCVFGSQMPTDNHTNTLRCFPVRWAPKLSPARTDYFHKYVVAAVSAHDGVAGTLADETSYEYLDGAAWHWTTSEFVKDEDKTWNEFRGYSRVRIRRGSGQDGPKTMSEDRFYRGMDGDKLPTGTRTRTVADSRGVARTDSDWLTGFSFETANFENEAASTAPDPRRLVTTIKTPVVHGPTATRGPFSAYIVRPGTEEVHTAVGASGERTTRTVTTYDTKWGLPTEVDDLGDVSTDTDDICATTTYLPNEGSWLINFPSRVEAVSLKCDQTPQFPADAVSDTLTYYDGQTEPLPPTKGNPTEVLVADTRPASGPVYASVAKSTYDTRGRALTSTDPLGNTTTSVYTPTVAGPATQVATTTPAPKEGGTGFTTTSTLEALRGQPTKNVDTNGRTAELAYDALGRSIKAWLPNRPRGTYPNNPSYEFAYQISNTAPNVVTTKKVGPLDNYVTSQQIYDGLLRPRQVQTVAPGGGRVLTDTRYDSQGRVSRASLPYYNSGAVDTKLWFATDNTVPAMTDYTFDSAGRPTVQKFLGNGTEMWRTTSTFGGDRVTVTPPEGGTSTTTVTDARGRKVELRQHGPNGDDVTTYEHTPAGQLAKLTDPGGNIWTYGYDLRGRRTIEVDPDRGESTYIYDNADQLVSVTDARDVTLVYEYDDLGRRTVLHRDSVSGPRLADWTYDTVAYSKGQPVASTRYIGSAAYTSRVTAYTPLYQPARVEVEIPAAEGPELAGKYASTLTYKADGSLASESYAAAGALPAETVNHAYNELGLPTRTWGGYSGKTFEYVLASDYTRYGEMQTVTLGQDTKRAWLSYFYEDETRRLKRTVVDAEVANPMQADVNYTYDDIGNITSIADIPAGKPADVQCFRYDHLRRITDAWTPTTGCTADPTPGTIGGPAPYWHTYGFDKTGNRIAETQHTTTGDTTRTYTYQGHRLNTVTTTEPGGTTLDEYGYDPVGNTTSRVLTGESQTLEWDDQSHLTKVTENGQETSYVYTADGDRLLRRDPAAVTLYLGNQEIRLDRHTKIETGTRYYTHAGQRVATRNEAGLHWIAGDRNGTAEASINSVTQQTTRRRHLPFGTPRDPTPPSSWPDERGFVGGTIDATTGLTHLGAREYDPDLGRFISVDPILDLADPQQMNGYTYSNNNPTTFTDPTGLKTWENDNGGWYDSGACKPGKCSSTTQQTPAPPDQGIQTYLNSPILGDKPSSAVLDALRDRGYKGSPLFTRRDALEFAAQSREAASMMCEVMADVDGTSRSGCSPDGGSRSGTVHFLLDICGFFAEACDGVNAGLYAAEGNYVDAAISGAATMPFLGIFATFGKWFGKGCSFAGDTEVLMADGTTKPIKDIEVGDHVQATDPETGQTSVRTVAATWYHTDNVHDLVTGNGATVTTTEDHPYWNATDHEWQRADQLDPGDQLHTANGTPLLVAGLRPATIRTVTAYTLTVRDVHTYYVLAGESPVLTHNCGGPVRLSDNRIDTHVLPLHGAGSPATGSKFSDDVDPDDLEDLANEVVRGAPTPVKVDTRNNTHTHEFDVGRVVGEKGETWVRVWVDNAGNVTTMHPFKRKE